MGGASVTVMNGNAELLLKSEFNSVLILLLLYPHLMCV